MKNNFEDSLNKLKKIRKELLNYRIIRELDETDKQLLLLSIINLEKHDSNLTHPDNEEPDIQAKEG